MKEWISLDAGLVKRLLVRGKVHLSIVAFLGRKYGVIVFNALMVNCCRKSSDFGSGKLRYSKTVVRLHYPTTEKMSVKPDKQRILGRAHADGLRPHGRAPLRAHTSQLTRSLLEYVLQIGSFGSF